MSDTVTYTTQCGCVFDVDVYHDWVDGVTGVEDVTLVSQCEKHSDKPDVPAQSDCEQTFHELMKLQGKKFCSECGVRL